MVFIQAFQPEQISFIEAYLSFKEILTLSKQAFLKAHLTTKSFWCFVFVTLFNLQGARRSSAAGVILPHSQSFVKHFFQVFLKLFSHPHPKSWWFGPLLTQRIFTLPHFASFVKNFFRLFSKLFVPGISTWLRSRWPRGQLWHNNTLFNLCQEVFSSFFIFFHIYLFFVYYSACGTGKSAFSGHLPAGFPLAERQGMW